MGNCAAICQNSSNRIEEKKIELNTTIAKGIKKGITFGNPNAAVDKESSSSSEEQLLESSIKVIEEEKPKTELKDNKENPFVMPNPDPIKVTEEPQKKPTFLPTEDCSFYDGESKGGMANGKGKYTKKNGDVIEGHWISDYLNGEGTYRRKDGSKFKGEFQQDQANGRGSEVWADSTKFEGTYSKGMKNGQGTILFSNGNMYKGTFTDNRIEGFGEFKWRSGKYYRGEFKDDQMDGKGVLMWPDNRKYSGEFSQNKFHGFGTFEWPSFERRYEGTWYLGRMDGKGKVFIEGKLYGEVEYKLGEYIDGSKPKSDSYKDLRIRI